MGKNQPRFEYDVCWDYPFFPKIVARPVGEFKTITEARRFIKERCKKFISHWQHISKAATTQDPE